MADNLGMVMTVRADAKGLVAEMRNAEGQVIQTARVMRSQLKSAADETGRSLQQFKAQMGQSREVAMFFTQSLGELGPQGRTAQIAISGIAGAIMGGGGVLLALSLAQAAVRLLVDWWKQDAEDAKEAAKKHLEAAEALEKYNRALSKDANAHIATLQGMKQAFNQLTEAQKAHNVVQQINMLMLQATTPAIQAMLKVRLEQAKQLEQEIELEEALAKGKKSKEERAKQEKQTTEERKKATDAYMKGVNMEVQAEIDAASERGQLMLKEQELDQRRLEKKTKDQAKAFQDLQQQLAPVMNAIEGAFQGLVAGTANVSQALRSILASVVGEFLKAAIKQVFANAAVAGSGAAASQASIPWIGPALAAAAQASMVGMVLGLTSLISASGGADLGGGGPFPAVLHANEMVLPASIAEPLRESLRGGAGIGGGVNLTINATDAKSVRRLFLDNGPALAEAIGKAARDGRRFG